MNKKTNSPLASAPAVVGVSAVGNGQPAAPKSGKAAGAKKLETTVVWALLAVAVILFFVHFLFYRHSFPPINTDESSFFSPAQSLATKGRLSSDVHRSFLPGAGLYTYWMPPLYAVLLGGVFAVFGSTVVVAKLLSIALTIGSTLLLMRLSKNRYTQLAAAALFLICPFIIITSAFIRVEALAIFLTALAILAVKRNGPDWALGAVAALGIMTHPLMLACAAGLGFTSLRRGVKPLLFFAAGFALAIAPYVWYVLQDVAVFREQMSLQLMRKAKASLLDVKPIYLLQSVPMVLLALFCLYRTKAENAFRLFLAVSVVLALAIVLRSNEFNYQVYLVPYAVAALVLAMDYKKETASFRWVLPFALYGLFSLLLFSKLVKYKFRTDDNFNQLVTHLQTNQTWKGKSIFVGGGPDVATHLMMWGQNIERQVPVPQPVPANWFDKYNHVIEVRENGGENIYEEKDKPRPWRRWQSSVFTTADSAYTLTQYSR